MSTRMPMSIPWRQRAARRQKLLTINMAPREMSLSPDGKRLAFCASVNEPVQSYTEPDLWVMDLAAERQAEQPDRQLRLMTFAAAWAATRARRAPAAKTTSCGQRMETA